MKRVVIGFVLMILVGMGVMEAQTCKAPENIALASISTSSATIRWDLSVTGNDAPDSYFARVTSASGTVVMVDSSLVAPLQTCTITGLTASTTYTVELSSTCNLSGISETETFTFSTPCAAQAAPYTEDFNTSAPSCTYSSNATWSNGGRTGKCMALTTTTNDAAYIVFPALSLASNDIEATVWMKASSVAGGNAQVMVGIVTDPANLEGTFEPLYTRALSTTTWTEVRMNTSATQQTVTQSTMIAVMIQSGTNRIIYIDDVTIRTIPTCIRPENFAISNVTATAATFSWTTATSNVKIYLSSDEDTREVIASSSPYTISNLVPNTAYSFQIRAICSATDSSDLNPTTLTARTECVAADSALFKETFESLTVANAQPDCWKEGWWTKPAANTKIYPFAATTDHAHSGVRSMALLKQTDGSVARLTTQAIPIDSAGKYTLSVWIYRQEASGAQEEGLKFWASSNPYDTIGATLLGYIPRHYLAAPAEDAANEWYNYEFVINTTGTKYIIIEGISQDAAQVCFDDLEVKRTPSCFKVSNVTMGTPTYNSVGFTWSRGKNEQQWIVSYSLNDGATVTDTVSTPAITITGLTSATSYSVEGTITSYCGAGDMSDPVAFSKRFVTICEPLSFLPYSCGFESEELTSVANPLPLCWMRYNDATGADNTHPQASTSTAYSHSGTGYLKFLPVTSSVDYGEHQVAILPQLNTTLYPIDSLRLVFYGQATTINPAPVLTVGVMSNPADYSTFVAVDSFTIGTTSYLRYEAQFTNYNGNGTYIALMSRRMETSFLSLNIDDIRLEPIPSCADLDGAGVTVSDITDHNAKLTVSDPSATTWSLAYGTAGTPLSACTVIDTINGTSITLNNLSTQTQYVVYARRRCGNKFGSWSSSVTFRTGCGAFTIPYSDDFETYNAVQLTGCYHTAVDNVYLNVYSDASSTAGTYNHTTSGSKGLAASLESSTEYPTTLSGDATMAIYVHLVAGHNYELSIYARSESNGYNLAFVTGTTSSNLSAISTSVVNSTSWSRENAYFTPTVTGDYFVGVKTSPITSQTVYSLHLDDIAISEVSCVPPTSSMLSQLGSTTATINFTPTGTMWDVAVSNAPISTTGTVTGNVYRDTITTSSFTLNNLAVNTTYYYTIRSLCGTSGTSEWMVPESFHTRCTTANVPYTEGFETRSAVTCWIPLDGAGSVARETSIRYTGSSSMRATAVTAVSPEFNVTTFAPYMLSGWARSAEDSVTVSIGVMTDPDDASTIEEIATAVVTPANTWVEILSYFNILDDPDYSEYRNARYITLGTGNSTVYFDDLAIDMAPSCNRPTQGTLTAITGQSVTADWTENGTATQWQVYAVNPYGVKTTQTANAHPYTLTGLNPATSYSVYVRSICSAGDTSIAYKIGDITTECDYVTAPYSENFETYQVSATPQCWDISQSDRTSTYNNHPEYIWGIYSQGNNKSIRLYNAYTSSGNAMIVTPEIILPAGKNHSLRYDYCHQASSGALNVKIKRHSSNTYTTIATHYNNGTTDATSPSAFLTSSIGLQSYAGDTVQFMFYNYTDWRNGSIWVDNVKVRELSDCAALTALSVQDASANSVTIAFTDTAASHTQWQYAVVLNGHDVSEATPVAITAKMVTIPNLAPSTTYDIYVRAVCSATDFSTWETVTQKTLALPATLPYVTDFSNATQNNDWKRIGGGVNDFTFGNDGNATFATGSHAMYISNNSSTYTYDAAASSISGIGRLFSFGESSYTIEFDWKCSGGETVSDFGRFFLAPASADLLPTYSSAAIYRNYVWPDNTIDLDGNEPVCLVEGGNQHFSQVVDMTGRSGDYYLVFFWANDGNGGSNYPLAIGNLSVSELTCEPVVNLAIDQTSVSQSSATVTFGNPNPGADIRWAVSTTALITDTIASGTTQGQTITVTGLAPSTIYYLFVRAECSALDRSPWEYVQFQTECAAVTSFPFSESFESLTFPPICWTETTLTSVTTTIGVVDGRWEQASRNVHSGTKSAAFAGDQGTSALLATPALALDPDREYHVSFWLMQSGSYWNNDEVNVYVSTDATSTSGATQLAHYVIYNKNKSGNSLANFDLDLPSGLSGDHYILFEAIDVTNGYIYLDDVTVDIYPPCRNLTSQPTIVATTSTTASLTISKGVRTSIKYGIAPYSASPQPSQITTEMTTTTGDVTFTGLTPATSYSVFARGYCADGDSTSWTSPITITTKADDCFAPENLHIVGSVSDTIAAVAWNTVPNASSYQCVIGSDTTTVTTPQVTYTTLTQNTSYTLMVRGLCGTNDTTSWSTISFKTLTTPATLPYTTGFEAGDDNQLWQKLSSGYANNFIVGNDSEGHSSGARGLFISSDGHTYSQSMPTNPTPRYGVNLYGVTYYTRTIYFPAAGNYEVSFDWKCNPSLSGLSYEAYGRAFVAPTSATLPVDDDQYLRNLPEGAYAIGTNLNNSSSWQRTSSIFTTDAPQYMNLVFMWIAVNSNGYADPDDVSDTPLAIDNVSVNEVSCLPVNSIVTLSVKDTSATILITQPEPVEIEYAVLTTYTLDSITPTTIANTSLRDTINLTGLEAATTYYIVARQKCDSADRSSWSVFSFKTTATPASLPYVCDFEDDDENANWFYTQGQTNQFTIGTGISYGGTHSLYVSRDGSSYSYDTTALSFAYAHRIISLPAGLYEYSYDWQCNGEQNDDGARVFLLPADALLFKNSWLYGLSYTTVPKNAIALDEGWLYGRTSFTSQSGSFWVTEDKLYNIIVFWRNSTGYGNNPPIAIDNISISQVNCLPPTASVIKSSIGENTASVAVNNLNDSSALVYALATSADLADAIYYDTLPYAALDTIRLTSLSASSSYYVHLRSLCGYHDESFWTTVQFKTSCGMISLFPYSEGFENLNTTNGYVANAANAFCWSAINAVAAKPHYNLTATEQYEGSNSLRLTPSNTAPLYMLMPEMNDLNNLYLTFNSKFSSTAAAAGTISAGYLTDPTDGTTFVSVTDISRSTAWTAQSAIYTGIPAGSRMAFRYSGATSTSYNAFIDNVRVSRLYNGPVYNDTTCNKENYMLHGFAIRYNKLDIGDNTLTSIIPATVEGAPDTLIVAHVLRLADIRTTTSDTICGGQPYNRGMWNIPSPTTRTYTQTFRGASACGCDSAVVLNLTVIPVADVIVDTICHNGSYTFGDTVITAPGKYTRTYQNSFGCTCTDTLYLMMLADSLFDMATVCQNELPYTWRGQSITTGGRHTLAVTGPRGCQQTAILDLTVIKTDSTITTSICQGGSVQVVDTIISTAGTFTVKRIDPTGGCLITYHITTTITPVVPVDVYDYSCEGYTYTGNGINNLTVTADTVVTVSTRTVDARCDSATNVHIHFVPTVYNEIHETIKKGESYRFNGTDYTEAGTYTATFRTSDTNCDSVVTLYLSVTTGIETVSDIRMEIVPNPVDASATAYIYGDFNEVVTVEVINGFGQVIDTFVPSTYPIEVRGIQTSGIYNIRITTADGRIQTQKLIIK